MLMDNGVRLDELEDVLYQMSHEELLKEALEALTAEYPEADRISAKDKCRQYRKPIPLRLKISRYACQSTPPPRAIYKIRGSMCTKPKKIAAGIP